MLSKKRLVLNLIKTDLKRLTHYIPSMIIAVLIILTVCIGAAYFISGRVYRENTFTAISIAYYLPDDDDKRYNTLALGMLEDMKSMKEAASLVQVDDIDDGYHMIEDGSAMFFIIVPDNFFSGIMDSTNPTLTIVVRDNKTVASYIANELFLSYARYLGVAQAGIYSALDTARTNELDSDTIYEIQNSVNMIYLDRVINKDGYLKAEDITGEGGLSLVEHYTAVAVMLSLAFMAFVLAPLIRHGNNGIFTALSTKGIGITAVFAAGFISTCAAIYAAFLPCIAAISVIRKSFNISGLFTILPAIAIISLIINIIYMLCKNTIVAHMVLMTFTLSITYIGGGILPMAMLPKIIQEIAPYSPASFLISVIGTSLYGI